MTIGGDIDTKYLRIFVALGESDGFEAEGRQLGLSQATVSIRIRRLENKVGAKLFKRGRRGWRTQLTIAGHELLPDAQAMLALHDKITGRVRTGREKLW